MTSPAISKSSRSCRLTEAKALALWWTIKLSGRIPSGYRLSPLLGKGAYDESIRYGQNGTDHKNGRKGVHFCERCGRRNRHASWHGTDSFRLDGFQATPIFRERQPVSAASCVIDKKTGLKCTGHPCGRSSAAGLAEPAASVGMDDNQTAAVPEGRNPRGSDLPALAVCRGRAVVVLAEHPDEVAQVLEPDRKGRF